MKNSNYMSLKVHMTTESNAGSQELKKWKKMKKINIKMDMLTSIGKQSGESVESEMKKKVTVGRICDKGRF